MLTPVSDRNMHSCQIWIQICKYMLNCSPAPVSESNLANKIYSRIYIMCSRPVWAFSCSIKWFNDSASVHPCYLLKDISFIIVIISSSIFFTIPISIVNVFSFVGCTLETSFSLDAVHPWEIDVNFQLNFIIIIVIIIFINHPQ